MSVYGWEAGSLWGSNKPALGPFTLALQTLRRRALLDLLSRPPSSCSVITRARHRRICKGGVVIVASSRLSEGTLGYKINQLGNLPIDETVSYYIFFLSHGFDDPLSVELKSNFDILAEEIGDSSIIVRGPDRSGPFAHDVVTSYFGKDVTKFAERFPAILVTNQHPRAIEPKTLSGIFVPLDSVISTFGSWHNFYAELVGFVRSERDALMRASKRVGRITRLLADGVSEISLFGVISIEPEKIQEWARNRKDARDFKLGNA